MKQKVITILEPYRDKTLSFGCEVIVAGIAKDNPGCEHDVVVDDRKDEHGRIGMGYFGHVHPDDFQEIIGHPINLQDWLGVLWESNPNLEYTDAQMPLAKFGARVWYGLEKAPSDWIWFDAITGQPATEADYRSFCDIIGI